MIVVTKGYGQLGNRLFLYAHLIAAARHYGVTLANPCFAEYAHLFPATANDLWCRYPKLPLESEPPTMRSRRILAKSVYLASRTFSALRLTKFPCQVLRLRGEQSCDLAGRQFANLMGRRRPVLVDGWLFRSDPLLLQHADAVRDHFRIRSENQARVDQLVGSIRAEVDHVVGVHIRHGDYATYRGGQYFYRVDQYAQAMRRIANQLAPRRVGFLICGNAQFGDGDFSGLNVTFGSGDLIEDLYSFTKTDLLIGPPSTFTLWAAFYGAVPLSVMNTADHEIDAAMLGMQSAA